VDSFAGDEVGGPVAGRADDLTVDVAGGTGRERDSAELPESMRRDVRLLGEVLGEVISESAGADLLADVERLRHAVIAARSAADRGSAQAAAAGDEIMALVSAWSWDRAELVARAFTVYFHLVNLAEEEQRVRALRQRDSGNRPARESLADAVDRLTAEGGAEHLNRLLAGLRVHPVFTAHPTEARRRAVVASLRRVNELLNSIDDQRTGAAQQAEERRKLREEVDLLWRTAQLRVAGMTPADEVRSVMTAFDETLFRLVPSVYRALEQLEGLGLVQRIEVCRGTAGFERVDPTGHHHHHAICRDCGRMVPFEDPRLERALEHVAGAMSFDVTEHDVVLRGLCDRCAN